MAKAQGKNAAVDAIDDGMRELLLVMATAVLVWVRVRAVKFRLPFKRLWNMLATTWFVFR